MSTYQELSKEFIRSWNHHGMRTEQGQNPHQLFTSELQSTGSAALGFFEEVLDTYGIEGAENTPVGGDEQGIEIPPIDIKISERQMEMLQNLVNQVKS